MATADVIDERAAHLRRGGLRVKVLHQPEAHSLYARLRNADAQGAQVVLVAAPPETGLGGLRSPTVFARPPGLG